MTISEIEGELYYKLLTLRSIQRIIQTVDFKEAYNFANKHEKEELERLIDNYDKGGINNWIKIINERKILYSATSVSGMTIIYQYTVKELKIYARRIGVKYYNCKNKYELLSEIEDYIRMKEQNEKDNC